MDDDRIIDLSEYLGDREEDEGGDGAFGIYGADGEGSRFALPVWRAVYLLDGERGGIVGTGADTEALHPCFVLDLRSDPPRTTFPSAIFESLRRAQPPNLHVREGAAAVLLGRTPERSWYLVIVGEGIGEEGPDARTREDLLFLAGECAGLLHTGETRSTDE